MRVHASMGIGKRSIGCIIQVNMKKNLKPSINDGTKKRTGWKEVKVINTGRKMERKRRESGQQNTILEIRFTCP
jgi:hypothetical protein